MPTNVLFTDGYRQANYFVKELYVGSKWDQTAYPSRMILWQARNHTHPDGYLISIGLEYEYDDHTGMKHGFLSVGNNSSGPIKFDPKGMFKGVDCYIVVDWSVFLFDPSLTDIINGEICFGAVVDMSLATDIDNSPTIKKYLYGQRMNNLLPKPLPVYEFVRQNWQEMNPATTVNVGNMNELVSAITNNNNIRIKLTNNIPLSANGLTSYNGNRIFALLQVNNKNLVIDGDGHRLFDASGIETLSTESNGKYVTDYDLPLTGNETFVVVRGGTDFANGNVEQLTLARSNVYRASGWDTQYANSGIYGLVLLDNFPAISTYDRQDLFISYRISFMRFTYKVTSITSTTFFFKPTDNTTPNEDMRSLSSQTDFFLINYDGDNEGITIKDHNMFVPMCYKAISVSKAQIIFRAKENAKIDMINLKVFGGLDQSLRNDGEMRMGGCEVSNVVGGGVYNLKKLFVEDSDFHDIMDCGVRTDMIRDQLPNHSPYMEVTGCTFRDIGHYGTCKAAVWNTGRAYIAGNEFVNTNYCAIRLGANGDDKSAVWRSSLVERNFIHHTDGWKAMRQQLGLQDSGDIYVVANNEMAIIRYNRIHGCGGPGKNNAIYIDYWAYNIQIYGNVITGTENFYDIDCRDCSPEELPNNGQLQVLESGQYPTTNIFIGYNVCDGYVRIQENTVDVAKTTNNLDDSGCEFVNNVILNKAIEPEVANGVVDGNTYCGVAHCKDSEGIISDDTGMVASATLHKLLVDNL
ncbi:MAG: hypothetical protein J5867_06505 [Prevotella sp.]|nr:hypothetical protein [Prevotella sp.]